jgi:hypothetical protein
MFLVSFNASSLRTLYTVQYNTFSPRLLRIVALLQTKLSGLFLKRTIKHKNNTVRSTYLLEKLRIPGQTPSKIMYKLCDQCGRYEECKYSTTNSAHQSNCTKNFISKIIIELILSAIKPNKSMKV